MPIFELDRLPSYDDDALLVELRRVAAIVESPYLTAGAFDKHSKAHSSAIRRRFGGWFEALARANLQDRYSGNPSAKRAIRERFTEERLIAELRAVSDKIGGKPITIELFNQHAEMNAETIRRRFGSWWAGLKKAGLTISNHGKRYSEDEYFENLLAVWTHYGRQPKYGEMDQPPSTISSSAYERKWRTWRKALIAFLERVNSDRRQGDAGPPTPLAVVECGPKAGPRPRRQRKYNKQGDQPQIKLGLRYDVLKRDRFRCVLCGASPATHLGCVLHVDHVKAFSKGGKTVVENLRTLCEPCNLGKAAKEEAEAAGRTP